MSDFYQELHYRGDVTESAVPDSLLGCDWFGRPYRVVSADFDGEVTTVVLTYARPEDVTRHTTERDEQRATYERVRTFFGAAS